MCDVCGQRKLVINVSDKQGFAQKFTLICEECNQEFCSSYTSPRNKCETSERPSFPVNTRMVDAFVSLGKGYSGLQHFCIEGGTSVPTKTCFYNHLREISESNEEFSSNVLEKAREVVRNVHGASKDKLLDVSVSYDGTWQKRGHTSLNGAAFMIETLTGLVIDFEVLSKYCVKSRNLNLARLR